MTDSPWPPEWEPTLPPVHFFGSPRKLLLAEELVLLASGEKSADSTTTSRWSRVAHFEASDPRSDPESCLAGLLVAELTIDGNVRAVGRDNTVVLAPPASPWHPYLEVAAQVVANDGPRISRILSAMPGAFRGGLHRAATSGLLDAGVLALSAGTRGHRLIDEARWAEVVTRLRAAATDDAALDPRTALLLSMAEPAGLLRVIVPERKGLRQVQHRVRHALDKTPYEAILKVIHHRIAIATLMSGGG